VRFCVELNVYYTRYGLLFTLRLLSGIMQLYSITTNGRQKKEKKKKRKAKQYVPYKKT